MTFDKSELTKRLEQVGAPAEIRTALDRLCQELVEAAPENLVSVILFGGLARGRFRSGRSDVDLVVVLRDSSAAKLAAIAPPLRSAWRAVRVEPLLLARPEIPRLTRLFPTKLLDIQAHHVVLWGEDSFAGLNASPEEIRHRVEQELRNLELRLRRRLIAVSDDDQGARQAIGSVIRPLAIQLSWLLRLSGQQLPQDDRTTAIFILAAARWKLDGDLLANLAALRSSDGSARDVLELFDRLLVTVNRIGDIAEGLKVTP
jgi:predicted nucleotidyltransferase